MAPLQSRFLSSSAMASSKFLNFTIGSMAGLSIDQFAEQVDIENLSAMLSGLFGTEIPTANPSSNKPRYRNEFFSSEAATIFNELYSRDLSDLGYEELG